MSWVNLLVVRQINVQLFHLAKDASQGWWLYAVLRVLPVSLLVYTVWKMEAPGVLSSLERASERRPSRTWSFDPLMGLRAFACFMVVMGHYFLVVMPFSRTGIRHGVSPLLSSSPWAGVWVFFVLSGFLMGKGFASGRYQLDDGGMRSFLRNRFLRIAPIYYGSILVISVFRYPSLFEWKNWWMLLEMGLFDFRGDLPIQEVDALWSVSTEMQFYVLAPVLMLGLTSAYRRFGNAFFLLPVGMLCLGTAMKIVMAKHVLNMFAYGYTPLVANLDIFVCGLSLSLLPLRANPGQAARRWMRLAMGSSVVVFYLAICWVTAHKASLHLGQSEYWACCPSITVLFAASFIYLAEHSGKMPAENNLGGWFLRAVQWTGTLTYCLYVFHSDVFFGIASLVPKVHGLSVSLERFPLAMAETFAVAALFYYLVERPFELRKRVPGTALLDAP